MIAFSDFRGSSRAPQGWFKVQKIWGINGGRPENWYFSYTAAPADEAWAALAALAYSLGQQELQAGLTARGVNRVIHSVTLRCGSAGRVTACAL